MWHLYFPCMTQKKFETKHTHTHPDNLQCKRLLDKSVISPPVNYSYWCRNWCSSNISCKPVWKTMKKYKEIIFVQFNEFSCTKINLFLTHLNKKMTLFYPCPNHHFLISCHPSLKPKNPYPTALLVFLACICGFPKNNKKEKRISKHTCCPYFMCVLCTDLGKFVKKQSS